MQALALLFLGIFFRFYNPELYIFGFDQIQILENAQNIANLDFTLIGPRTGPANMFTGPLVYYIAAFFLPFFGGEVWALVAMSTFIAGLTGVALYLLAKKYTTHTQALFMLIVWTFSPLLLHFDRIAWNPNFSFLASLLVFFPVLHSIEGKKMTRSELVFIFLGSFLGFQAHFSGLLLPPLLFLSLLVFRKFSVSAVMSSGLGLLASITPTLIFDARNGWLNTRGFLSFLSQQESVGTTLISDRLLHSLKVTFQTVGSLIPVQLEKNTALFFGCVFMLALLWLAFTHYKNKSSELRPLLFSLVWIAIIIVLFSLYRSNSPEYYFFIYLPAFFFSLTQLFFTVFKGCDIPKRTVGIICIALTVYVLTNFQSIAGKASLQIKNQRSLAHAIQATTQQLPIASVAYDLLPVDALGMQYFVKQYVTLAPEGSVIHITNTAQKNEQYGFYKLWVDPRTQPLEYNYLMTSDMDLILQTPKQTTLLKNEYLGSQFGSHEVYEIAVSDTLTQDLLVVVKKIDNPFIAESKTFPELQKNATKVAELASDWKAISVAAYQGYLKEYENFLLVYIPNGNTQELPQNLLDFTAHSL